MNQYHKWTSVTDDEHIQPPQSLRFVWAPQECRSPRGLRCLAEGGPLGRSIYCIVAVPLASVPLQHGFARNLVWDIAATKPGSSPSVTMRLTENEYTRSMWDFAFDATFEVCCQRSHWQPCSHSSL